MNDAQAPSEMHERLHTSTAPAFGLLLEAAIAPHAIRDRIGRLKPLERDEALDALDHGGLKWSWLMLGWATENGAAPLDSSSVTVDQHGFVEALAEIGRFVDLEYSAPLQQRSASGPTDTRSDAARLRPLATQRLHVVERHEWTAFPAIADGEGDDLVGGDDESRWDEEAMLRDLPLFGEPANRLLDGDRIGEVWIRIAPHSRTHLLEDPGPTLNTLAIVSAARADLLRDAVHRTGGLDSAAMEALNRDLAARQRSVRDLEEAGRTVASAESADERRRIANRVLARYGKPQESYYGPLVRGELDHLIEDEFEWANELRDELELHQSELGCIITEYPAERALREKLDRWKRRVRESFEKVGLSAEANRIEAGAASRARDEANTCREILDIVIEELQMHPEEYESMMTLSPGQMQHDRGLFSRYLDVLPEDGASMQLILSTFNFAGPFENKSLHDLRRFDDLDSAPDAVFVDQKVERLRRRLSRAVSEFLTTAFSQTFGIKENLSLRQVPSEWDDEQAQRFTRVVKKLNWEANAVARAYKEFIEMGRSRLATETVERTGSNVDTLPDPSPTIGVITALPFEFAAFRELLSNAEERSLTGIGAGLRVTIGTVPAAGGGEHRVLLALADMGNNIAASRASRLLDRYPRLPLVMLGIAGGIPNPQKPEVHPRLGDVVVSDRVGVVQYDLQKQTADEVEFRHPPRPPHPVLLDAVRHFEAQRVTSPDSWTEGLDDLAAKMQTIRPAPETDVLRDESGAQLQHPADARRTSIPHVFFGPIASANTLLKSVKRRDKLRENFGALAVEMEAAGVADAAWQQGAGYLVVRGISDYCDGGKNDTWQRYAAAAAAMYLYRLLLATPSATLA